MYDEKAKVRVMRYMKEKRDKLTLNLAKGQKDLWRAFAEGRGVSLTAFLSELVAEEMERCPEEAAAARAAVPAEV